MMHGPEKTGLVRTEASIPLSPFDLSHGATYRRWRDAKLAAIPRSVDDLAVEIGNLAKPSAAETALIKANCRRANMAIYVCRESHDDVDPLRRHLRSFASRMGLVGLETHRSAGEDGIVALEVTRDGARYIPYTDRPLNWHTDGYYNAPSTAIRAFILHCVRGARDGGENGLLDPEIAYIRLREAAPALVAALMHPAAMTIPANVESNGRRRAPSTGPVFFIDPVTGALQMRYTARKRNIVWRDDADTRAAVDFLAKLLDEDEAAILRHKLAPGQGVICNNVLHNRTGFTADAGGGRLHLRARYLTRLAGT